MSEAARSHAVSLIGMMGAGKTTIGVELAAQLGWRYHDNDSEIESRAGKSVAQMFHEDGETTFRDWEQRVCEEALRSTEPVVVSVGGGAVLRQETRDVLSGKSWVVWLRAPIDVLIERVVDRHLDRPMIEHDPDHAMRALYEQREPVYESLADQIIDEGGMTPAAIANQIVERLREVEA